MKRCCSYCLKREKGNGDIELPFKRGKYCDQLSAKKIETKQVFYQFLSGPYVTEQKQNGSLFLGS